MTTAKRSCYLDVDEVRYLDNWCHLVGRMFGGAYVFLVGSVLERPDYRDVDIRILLSDEAVAALPMDRLDLNMLLSTWGRQQTGLRIDCQVQSATEMSGFYDRPRHPRGLLLCKRQDQVVTIPAPSRGQAR